MHEARRRVEACRKASAVSSQGLTDQLATLTKSKDASVQRVNSLKEKVLELVMKVFLNCALFRLARYCETLYATS